MRIELKEPVQETKFACYCDNKLYDDILSCQKECHVTLGCFVGICSPTEPRVCRTAVAYCNEIKVNAINVVLWEPTDPADQKPQCLAMAAAVDQAILAHDAAHVSSPQPMHYRCHHAKCEPRLVVKIWQKLTKRMRRSSSRKYTYALLPLGEDTTLIQTIRTYLFQTHSGTAQMTL